jgi:hypothetical protein
MDWEGAGPIETTSNTTTFPGFTGRIRRPTQERRGYWHRVVDGDNILVDGSTTNAEIESLEDTNISHPWQAPDGVGRDASL